MSLLRRALRHGLPAVALALVVVIAALVARVSEGRRAVEGCDAALARQDYVEAIVLARAAAEARCPWCEAPELGYAKLHALAKDAESRGDHPTAVAAWRAVRATTLATSVLDRSPARRERAEGEIARLEHRLDAATTAAGSAPSPAASEERLRAALATSLVPSGIVFALLAIGGALFAFGAVRFVRSRVFRVPDLVVAVAGGALAAAAVLVF